MESAIDLLQHKIADRHIRLVTEWRKSPSIAGVAGELRQVFSNLFANALEAVGTDGTIRLRISGCTARGGLPAVRITFSENGRGIPPESRRRIFEPLFTTKGAIGTGLGLWICKQLIEKHPGVLQMRSSTAGLRKGSTFSVLLTSASEVQE